MPSGEHTPLLSGNPHRHPVKVAPTALASAKHLLYSWFNILLIAVPFTFLATFLGWSAQVRFVFSFISIVPLAKLLGDATEQLSIPLGQTIGGLLNATFGNAVELIVGIVALQQNQLRLVQTSLLGSILSNILLVLGMSFFASGFKFAESHFQVTAAQTMSSLLVLSCITLVVPAAYHSSKIDSSASSSIVNFLETDSSAPQTGLLLLSRGTSLVLFFVYLAYLYFQLKSHASLFEADTEDVEEEEVSMGVWASGIALALVTILTAFCADHLVSSIDETCQQWNIPKTFVGLILLPLVGNAAEHVTSIWMAMKGKMELVMGIAVGSSIQIAAGMIPLLVIIGWAMGRELTLFFSNFETIILFVSVILVHVLIADGTSNWLEGLILMALYSVIALAFWVS
ncbi:calcium:hydrogen antiporter [Phaffia rhodozyma]|uniref:Vacuolar calcium ion transporter n=1 Tax=Phaffia rhodozyma TaxID=264483 RepID=A0A0F7SJ93_PHARH|nr:calcium:hydrogen antiporter [Phaffia rhodozyma]